MAVRHRTFFLLRALFIGRTFRLEKKSRLRVDYEFVKVKAGPGDVGSAHGP